VEEVHVKRVLELPEGWIHEPSWRGKCDCEVVIAPGIGYVTIDFHKRNFALGCYTHVPYPPHGKVLTGRGWAQKLVAAAVKALRGCER
jgi:hypothetical protein